MKEELRHGTALQLYFDATATIRHHDRERVGTHRIAIAVMGALLAFASSDAFSPDALILPLSVVGMLLSLVFLAISRKYAALVDRERAKARAARDALIGLGDSIIADVDRAKWNSGGASQRQKLSLSALWSALYVVMFIGFLVLGAERVLSLYPWT